MPEVVASTRVDRSIVEVWEFVQDMDNWAPMLKGYVGHRRESETDSTWTLTGDLGPFTKTIDVKIQVTDWQVSQRVAFRLEGVTELVTGEGALDLGSEAPPRTRWQRFLDWLLGRSAVSAGGSQGGTHVTFTFAVQAGGPMGPMINPMLGPYSAAVAKELVAAVAEHLAPDSRGPS